jgi:SAM-dependent methyltransferase
MKTIEESVVSAMDGSDKELYPFLPYILQDLWEIGADPDTMIRLTGNYFENHVDLKVLDLGCGKGAVSVKLSQKLGCTCYGIDAVPEFIAFARQKAIEYNVNNLCTFETGDIRKKVKDLKGFDVVILGSIGPVFGDYYTTLSLLANCINENGIFIIDDAYIDDSNDYTHSFLCGKSTLLHQINKAGMKLIENVIADKGDIKESNDTIFDNFKKRCLELIEKYPDKRNLFYDYIRQQEIENNILENKVIATTMVITKNKPVKNADNSMIKEV